VGTGFTASTLEVDDSALEEAISIVQTKSDEIKTKQNQTNADLNYIKAKVDAIWDKVK